MQNSDISQQLSITGMKESLPSPMCLVLVIPSRASAAYLLLLYDNAGNPHLGLWWECRREELKVAAEQSLMLSHALWHWLVQVQNLCSEPRVRKPFTLCTTLEQLLLNGIGSSDSSALNLFVIWGKLVELLHKAWKSTPGYGKFKAKHGSIDETYNYYLHIEYIAFLNL